jgi:hypothetical protein
MRRLTTTLIAAAGAALAGEGVLRLTGEDLAWKIETRHFIVELGKTAGAERSGQINTIFLKDHAVLLTRDRPTSSLHLSPNAAIGDQWIGINRWNPPVKFHVRRSQTAVEIAREGEMPAAPGLWVQTKYEFPAAAPEVRVEETITTTTAVRVRLLRLCEWSFAPGPENPFTHVAWEDAAGNVHVEAKGGERELPLNLRWQAFLNLSRGFGVAAVVERVEYGESPVLQNACSRFAGDPHYFYRVLVSTPDAALTAIPRGRRYFMRYRIYVFGTVSGRPAERVSRFYRSLQGASRQ